MGLSLPSIALITQETRMKGLRSRWATAGAAKFRLKQTRTHVRRHREAIAARRGPATGPAAAAIGDDSVDALAAFTEYEEEDLTYEATVERVKRELQGLELGLQVTFVDREYLHNFDFRRCLVVVVVGRDGLVANAAKYVGDLPIVAVNPDPKRIDGVLLPFRVTQVRHAVQRALDRTAKVRHVTMAEVTLNDGQSLLAFNEFFLGCRTHVSARYTLRVDTRSEAQSSSGLIVSTGAGSTGWLSSMFNMAEGFAQWMGGQLQPRIQLSWEDPRLVWGVREPFRSKNSGADLVVGFVEQGEELTVESLMPADGVIFSDGVETDFLEFTSGTVANFTPSSRRATLVVG